MTKQTLCPYTGTTLGSEGGTNREHVTPVAIGAPAGFFVEAHEASNSYWNEKIDAAFSNDHAIRFLAMANNVRSRSGDVVSKLDGTISETGDIIKLELSNNGIGINFTQPVSKGPDGYTVKGYGDKAFAQTEELKRNLQRKGIRVSIGQHTSIQKPTVSASFSLDFGLANQQLIKSAYLYTVWCLGDKAINSKNREQYINALNGGDMLSANISFSESLQGSHQFTLLVLNGMAYCEVDLFGALRALFVTNLELPTQIFAQYSRIELKGNQFIENKNAHDLLLKLVKRLS